jgi:ferredoxin-NADP reductase
LSGRAAAGPTGALGQTGSGRAAAGPTGALGQTGSGRAAAGPTPAVRQTRSWQLATVTAVRTETATVRTIELQAAAWAGHRAGQHLDVRLTAEDGYRAERSYSIASAPGEPPAITVQRLEDGEVSPYLTDELRAGDELEVRGPIGGYFVWDTTGADRPLLLAAGGSGIVPLRSILRHRERTGSTVPARLLYSVRSLPDVIYRDEIDRYAADGVPVTYALTRLQPPGWTGHRGRVDGALLAEVAWPAPGGLIGQARQDAGDPVAYVCGPTAFVESIAEGLTELGYAARRVKTERFGGAGGP